MLALSVTTVLLATAVAGTGCLSDSDPATSDNDGGPGTGTDGGPGTDTDSSVDTSEAGTPDDPTKNDAIADSTQNITYRDDLANHPGCTKEGIEARLQIDGKPGGYTAATLPDFPCSAKAYPAPANEDTTRAIIVLVHGNSSTPADWEAHADDPADPDTPMIAERLVADGWRVFAADFRYDKVPDPADAQGNPAKNFDHGWATPILERLLKSLHAEYPSRKINLAGFSLGTTIIRDALRRMHHRGEKPFEFVHALHLASGANHGVVTFSSLCGDPNNPTNKTMRGTVACQLGNRDNYAPTPFLTPLNGTNGDWETPCANGINAYGQNNVCGGNKVLYTTVVYKDPPNGPLQDEFVSETSSALKGAENKTVTQEDTTTYFLNGLFKIHNGSIRSAEGVTIALQALER
ncbi:MAG: hypothetical protein KF782_04785 [Labilithrix sp.]|nr:hypothetical protein [Labilithrix sp.]